MDQEHVPKDLFVVSWKRMIRDVHLDIGEDIVDFVIRHLRVHRQIFPLVGLEELLVAIVLPDCSVLSSAGNFVYPSL